MNPASPPPRPLRILEIETFGRGGLLHYAYNLSCALAERGHEVTLLSTVGYELEGAPLPAGLRVEKRIARWTQGGAGSSGPWRRKMEAIFDAFTTAWFARRLSPDVVHFHGTNLSALVYLALLRLLGLRIVSTVHVVTPHEPLPLGALLYGTIHRLPHHLIAHSAVDRTRLQKEIGIKTSGIDVIPHGEYGFFGRTEAREESRSAVRERLGLVGDEEVALFFGYIREYKGLDLLLEAWPAVHVKRPNSRLLVVGNPDRLDPDRRSQLKEQALNLGAICRFEYIPFDEVSQYFVAADVLVMPYRRISQSGVLYLALSLGVPIVASRVGALPEMLEDGVQARLVPAEDVESLAQTLAETLGDPALRRRLAEAGRRLAETHSWPSIAATTESMFVELASAPGPTEQLE